MSAHLYHPQDWISEVRPGDVVRSKKNGDLRVVRQVTQHRCKLPYCRPGCKAMRSFTLLIRHCSWTGRGYTILFPTDMRLRYEPTGANVGIDQGIEALLKLEKGREKLLTCCDMKGLP
jgi:hypothetical protein